ncbi:MAG TPA: aldehyde dehydrogenase family protein [Myxococcales bacterium]|nr:aldehyde dehydrogenase family protein [Myxococcales bacterium]
MTQLFREERLLIDGELVRATNNRTYDNINPATEEVIGVAADAGPDDIERAIAAARRAFDETDWSRDHSLRSRCIRQLHDAFQSNLEPLRESYVAEVGCPVNMTSGPALEVPVRSLGYYADFIEKFEWSENMGEADTLGMGKAHRWIEREAVGVVGAITAWNFPHELNLKKVGWALASGCTVVLKGAPATPWCTLLLGKLIQENTDIPPGVINTITSSRNDIGEQITTDPRVDMVSFTGSTAVGKHILEVTAPFVKRVSLELGGKSALILLDDMPGIPDIAAMAGASVCMHAGQGCAILSRILVPNDHLAEAAEKLKVAMANVKVGDPTDPETVQGPQCSAAQRDRVEALIQQGIDEGATLLCGGGRPAGLTKGYYVEPTAFVADPDSIVAQQEFFGPVQCLIGYEDEEDAIRIANNSSYGLSGGILGLDIERAKRVARRIRTGTMMINGGMWYGPDMPFGGYKQSGLGRENGVAGFEEFLEIKALAVPAG